MDNLPKQSKIEPWWQSGLILFFKLSTWIALPIVISLFLGKFLDRTFDTEPWIFLGLTGIAFFVSTFAIYYEYSKVLKNIEKENNKKLDDK